MRDDPKTVGDRLVATRIALGFDQQKDFAEQLGVGRSTLNPYETGARPLSYPLAHKIQDKFQIPVNWTFKGDPTDLPEKVRRKLFPTRAKS